MVGPGDKAAGIAVQQDSQTKSKKVMIATASVGAGHNSAARAICAGLAQKAPHIQVELVDVIADIPRLYRAYYQGGFAFAMSRFPRIYGLGFWLTDFPDSVGRGAMERFRLWHEGLAMRRFRKHFLEFQPDVVMHTHFLAPPMLNRVIQRHGLSTKQFVLMTDNGPHRFWFCENVKRWFLPSELPIERMHKWGIAEESITLSGMAIHPRWLEPLDKSEVCKAWRLPEERQIVLLSGGTEFTCGPVVKLASQIVQLCPQVCLVVLAGRNKKLLGQLTQLNLSPDRLVPVSFTDRVHELVDVASVMITKAGGISTAECLSKGTPMILARPVPGQEGGNAKYFEQKGAAVVTRSYRQVPYQLKSLLDDKERLQTLADNARNLYRPGTQTIVDAICDELGC